MSPLNTTSRFTTQKIKLQFNPGTVSPRTHHSCMSLDSCKLSQTTNIRKQDLTHKHTLPNSCTKPRLRTSPLSISRLTSDNDYVQQISRRIAITSTPYTTHPTASARFDQQPPLFPHPFRQSQSTLSPYRTLATTLIATNEQRPTMSS